MQGRPLDADESAPSASTSKSSSAPARSRRWSPSCARRGRRSASSSTRRATRSTWPPTIRSLGGANAPVTLVEFSDFQCPFCARVMPTLKKREGDLRRPRADRLEGLPADVNSPAGVQGRRGRPVRARAGQVLGAARSCSSPTSRRSQPDDLKKHAAGRRPRRREVQRLPRRVEVRRARAGADERRARSWASARRRASSSTAGW